MDFTNQKCLWFTIFFSRASESTFYITCSENWTAAARTHDRLAELPGRCEDSSTDVMEAALITNVSLGGNAGRAEEQSFCEYLCVQTRKY